MSLDNLRAKRQKWVEANRENGFEEGIKRLLTELYPDNAHFIYELLQNAEDPRATTVRFTLSNKEVEFEHDGERLFSLKDVESITSIGVSTKRDDPTSIGKFGVGFKAVFAYTNTPEIHSGEFHFRIHDLVVPETHAVKRPRMGDRETRFTFPFDHPTKTPAEAVEDIERGLRALGDNTLLFLSHIRTIEYLLPDGSLGSLERIDHDDGHIEIHACHPGGGDTISHWLRFEKDVSVIGEDGKTKTCRIAIAYSLVEEEDSRKRHPVWKIVPLDHGQVSIYFPAEKETSNLRFHIHAPFASTVARDSVRDCEANNQLRNHIADLVVESLVSIRDKGMLTMSFLAVMPNEEDKLPAFYEPIRKAIVQAFKDENLVPTRSGSHAPRAELYRGPARIAEVLNDDDLSLLTSYGPPLWAANPPQQNQREDRFLDSLEIEEWGWAELAKVFGKPHRYPFLPQHKEKNTKHKHLIENWIAKKDDPWLMRLYALLGHACDVESECIDAGDLRIVRVETAQGHTHVLPREAFLHPEQVTDMPRDIFFVKHTVYDTGRSVAQKRSSRSFLEHIGVRPFDEKAVIELKLAGYDDSPPETVKDTYYRDLKLFMVYWKKNPGNSDIFSGHNFLLSASADGALNWDAPENLCLDSPYEETGLAGLADIHGKDAIWEGYKEKQKEPQLKDFVGFLKEIGVMHDLKVERVRSKNNPDAHNLRHDYRQAGVKWTNTAIDKDYSISDIEQYLAVQSVLAGRLIWHALIQADKESATACFRPNQQYETRYADSQLVYYLKRHEWIPDKSGVFHKPADMRKDDLRTDFLFDDRNGLLTAIGFGETERKQDEKYRQKNEFARSNGFDDAEHMELAQKATRGKSKEELTRMARESSAREEFPEKPSANPALRQKRMVERRENAPAREKVSRERTIEPGLAGIKAEAKAYLRGAYTNGNGKLICQCCHDPMPFKLPGTDQDYFEAVQFIKSLKQGYYENYLALCPTCAAKYQHACTTDQDEIKRQFLETYPDGERSIEVEIETAGKQAIIRFVGAHSLDLKIILPGNNGV